MFLQKSTSGIRVGRYGTNWGWEEDGLGDELGKLRKMVFPEVVGFLGGRGRVVF